MTLKLLTEHHLEFLRLKGGCTDSSESTLVKMQHCWKSHVRAQIVFLISLLKHAVDTKKKRLNETFLLSTINIQCVNEIYFSYFSTKTYSVGTQKNCLNEAVLLSPLTYKMKLFISHFYMDKGPGMGVLSWSVAWEHLVLDKYCLYCCHPHSADEHFHTSTRLSLDSVLVVR